MQSCTFKEKTFASRKVKLFCLTGLFLPKLGSKQGCEWTIIGEIIESSLKSKSRSHLSELYKPPNSKAFVRRNISASRQ